jgi:hypothetical protein
MPRYNVDIRTKHGNVIERQTDANSPEDAESMILERYPDLEEGFTVEVTECEDRSEDERLDDPRHGQARYINRNNY